MFNFSVPALTNVIIILNNWLLYIESLLVDQDNNVATLKDNRQCIDVVHS